MAKIIFRAAIYFKVVNIIFQTSGGETNALQFPQHSKGIRRESVFFLGRGHSTVRLGEMINFAIHYFHFFKASFLAFILLSSQLAQSIRQCFRYRPMGLPIK